MLSLILNLLKNIIKLEDLFSNPNTDKFKELSKEFKITFEPTLSQILVHHKDMDITIEIHDPALFNEVFNLYQFIAKDRGYGK